ncbi:MAG TPA: hypothetical protein VF755_00125 [Catenuloplanes sp.]|jgi:hypothetical protein
MTSRRVALTTAFLTLAAGGTAACDDASDYDQDEVFYCADANGTVVDEDYCDDDGNRGGVGGGFFLWHSVAFASGYAVGTKLPPGGSRFPYNDQRSRSAYGLPATGKVSNGTVKTNVVGKGGAPAKGSSGKSSGG